MLSFLLARMLRTNIAMVSIFEMYESLHRRLLQAWFSVWYCFDESFSYRVFEGCPPCPRLYYLDIIEYSSRDQKEEHTCT
jgi:hypothetical protein